jgi:N-acetyl sugar amidotransferase
MTDQKEYKLCTKGIWDTTVPGITFDETGASNYSRLFEIMAGLFPRGDKGKKEWENFVTRIKKEGKGKQYDCIIGVSGGTDSSYLLHLAKEYGLRPLAVTLDNGWSSDISVKNIRKVTSKLNIDLETYVIEYEEIKDILRSCLKASLPWVDFPTDHAIKSILYRTANREGIRYILIGHDFRSEGTQPNEWTYGDSTQLKYILKNFGSKKIRSFPNMSLPEHIWIGYIKKIKMIYPFFFLDYNKKKAQEFLKSTYNWEYYGGHHHENLFTRFAIAYWMPQKFGIDKRIITLSAQVMSGEITRAEALEIMKHPPCDADQAKNDRDYTIKKLGLTEEEFVRIWNLPNKYYTDYPSEAGVIKSLATAIKPFVKYILPQMPSYFIQLEVRKRKVIK